MNGNKEHLKRKKDSSQNTEKKVSEYLDFIKKVTETQVNSQKTIKASDPVACIRPSERDPANLNFILADKETHAIKIALLGDGGVGKTSIRKSYLGEAFSSEYLLTLGADFAMKTTEFNGKEIKFQIWDLSGQLRFSQVRQGYYNGCYGGILIFDRTRPDTLDDTMEWLTELWKNSGKGPVPFLILGNKSDLVPGNVDLDKKARLWAKTFTEETEHLKGFSVSYLQTSAKTGQNVEKAFNLLAKQIFSWIEFQNI
jgi:Ras-related protein Rab-1A